MMQGLQEKPPRDPESKPLRDSEPKPPSDTEPKPQREPEPKPPRYPESENNRAKMLPQFQECSTATVTEDNETSSGTRRDLSTKASLSHYTTVVNRGIEHLHKLEKKNSCNDLYSRLKTRKLLGVGQTPDGDVHRSKLSQILGHNEQLYQVQPRGLTIWRYVNAIGITGMALVSMLFPHYSLYYQLAGNVNDGLSALPFRLHGSALLAMSLLLWKTMDSTEVSLVRVTLLSALLYWPLDAALSLLSLVSEPHDVTPPVLQVLVHFGLVAALTSGSCYYYLLTQDSRGSMPQTSKRCSTSSDSASSKRGGSAPDVARSEEMESIISTSGQTPSVGDSGNTVNQTAGEMSILLRAAERTNSVVEKSEAESLTGDSKKTK